MRSADGRLEGRSKGTTRRPFKQLAALDYRAGSRPDQALRNLETLVNRLKTTMFDS
jgi:hypothetical protein